MAEALVNAKLGGKWKAFSAGTMPAGYVHPLALLALSEQNIPTDSLLSKSVAEFEGANFDLAITVCDDASENCPIWLGDGQVKHIPFPDPALAKGTANERLDQFRQVRDAIQAKIIPFLAEL